MEKFKEELMKELNMSEEELEDHIQITSFQKADAVNHSRNIHNTCEQKPQSGQVLYNKNDELVIVHSDYKLNKHGDPVELLYCNAYVDEEEVDWYLHDKTFGFKCIIMPSSKGLVYVDEDERAKD